MIKWGNYAEKMKHEVISSLDTTPRWTERHKFWRHQSWRWKFTQGHFQDNVTLLVNVNIQIRGRTTRHVPFRVHSNLPVKLLAQVTSLKHFSRPLHTHIHISDNIATIFSKLNIKILCKDVKKIKLRKNPRNLYFLLQFSKNYSKTLINNSFFKIN